MHRYQILIIIPIKNLYMIYIYWDDKLMYDLFHDRYITYNNNYCICDPVCKNLEQSCIFKKLDCYIMMF